MKFVGCIIDKESVNKLFNLSDLLDISKPDNVQWNIVRTSPYLSLFHLLICYIAKKLDSDYNFDAVIGDSDYDIVIYVTAHGKELNMDQANDVQNLFYDIMMLDSIQYDNNNYDGFFYAYKSTEFEYDIIEWPASQDLVDNGESVIMINDEYASKLMTLPAYFVLK